MVAKAVVMTCASSAIMNDASAVTPSTQFFSPLALASCIASLRFVSAASCGGSWTGRMGRGRGFGRKLFFGGRILLRSPNVQGVRGGDLVAKPMESMMKRTLIRYKTKPALAAKNAELIAGLFADLRAGKPKGLRYLALRLDDDTFVHFVESEADSGSALP